MNTCDKTPHYIAIYLDSQFKKGFNQLSKEDID